MSKNIAIEKASKIIEYIYTSELMGTPLSSAQAFESGDFDNQEIKKIDKIAEKYEQFKKLIQKYLKGTWSWERIAPLERAILIYGAFELMFKDKGTVTNGLVILTKGYIPGDSFKFINAILDKMGDYYESIKGN